ncbi:MAG: hypothetical protein DRJ59_03495 [Thermoprotei archaeon]|nr:MAG: hypothetical protein DRJ59_03495 [Thermoprotei archaeon]
MGNGENTQVVGGGEKPSLKNLAIAIAIALEEVPTLTDGLLSLSREHALSKLYEAVKLFRVMLTRDKLESSVVYKKYGKELNISAIEEEINYVLGAGASKLKELAIKAQTLYLSALAESKKEVGGED